MLSGTIEPHEQWPNLAAAGNGATVLSLYAECFGRAVPEPRRWPEL